MKTLNALALAAALALGAPGARAASDTYTATPVDHAFGDEGYIGIAMNASAQVVGVVWLPDYQFWYTGPQGLGVSYAPTGMSTNQLDSIGGINDAGQLAGAFHAADGYLHAFVSGPAGQGYVDMHPAGAIQSAGTAIDSMGRIVGYAASATSTRALHTGADGKLEMLGTLGGDYARALGVNDRGVVVGESKLGSGIVHAFATGAGGRGLRDLGTLGGQHSAAAAVSQTGYIVGEADDAAGVNTAFIIAPRAQAMQSVVALDPSGRFAGGFSDAGGVDASGHVVGEARLAKSGLSVAYVTGRGGKGMHDLNLLVTLPAGHRIDRAAAINASGQIVANDADDGHAMWLLTPTRATWAEEIDAQ